MDDNLAPYLSPDVLRIMLLFKQHDHDLDKLLAAHPEISPQQVAKVTAEVVSAMGLAGGSKKPAKRTSRKKPQAPGAYQIKITLRGSKPPIWRRVIVPGGIMLDELHTVIQIAMGWEDDHLHMFRIGGQIFTGVGPGGYEPEMGNGELDEAEYRLCDLIDREKTKLSYQYDFGDSWEHTLVVEKILPKLSGSAKIVCLAGKGRCPPEDCGGIWGYYHLLEVLANPSHKEHAQMKDWTGGSIDPDEFDAAEASKSLAKIRIRERR